MSARFKFGETAFYFIRHGETFESREGVTQGQSESRLTEAGRRSAEALARQLRDCDIGSIYSSPLVRAWTTASIISEATGAPVEALPGLKERYWGIYQGRPKSERPNTPDPRTAETLDAFSARVMAALRAIKGPNPVLVVAHSGVFRALARQLSPHTDSAASIANTQLVEFAPPAATRADWRISEICPRDRMPEKQ